MEKSLNIITLSSPLHGDAQEITLNREILPVLRSHFVTKELSYDQISADSLPDGFTVLFIATGGTEELFLKIHKLIPQPVVILSDSYHNSLAASLEICSWMHNNNIMHKHIVFPIEPSRKVIEEILEDLDYTAVIQSGFSQLKRERIGLIGGESPWLISSKIDKGYIGEKYGVTFVEIDPQAIIKDFEKESLKNASVTDFARKVATRLDMHTKEETLEDAVRFYNVLLKYCEEFNLTSLTIKCFDILVPCNTTACLALALLNDKGITAGCEGDIPSMWSMIISRVFCGKISFMANPSSIERVDNSIDFAHCTAPLSLSEEFTLTSHYESKLGIGVKAKMSLGKYTLFKCAGEKLNKFYIFEGEVVQNTSVIERCRTQIKFTFKSEDDMDDYLNSYLGNHTILIPGKNKKVLKRVMKYMSEIQ
jgi:L-fucose isomerase-like protein